MLHYCLSLYRRQLSLIHILVGVPGRIVKRDNVKMPRSDMDQCHLPDPVKEDITVLQRENAELVNRVLDLEQAVRILSADAQKTK